MYYSHNTRRDNKLKRYLDLLKDVYENGVDSDDRTGVGTRGVFGRQMRFDLSKGFPLLTTKKVHFKSVAIELLFFLSGETNIKYLKDNGVSIWDEWRKPYIDHREIVEINPRICQYAKYTGDFSTNGVNYKGNSIDDKLRNIWVKMMKRCYDPKQHNFKFYGGQGVSVHKTWHDCAKFVSDVKTIPHWYYKLNDWNKFELDKDYYSSNQYGPQTSVWLSSSENNIYTKQCGPCVITNSLGEVRYFLSRNEAARSYGISNGSIHRFFQLKHPKNLKGYNKKFEGWSFENVTNKNLRSALIENGDLGRIYGAQWRDFGGNGKDTKGIDQISWVMREIKKNPSSRRLVVSAWNPVDLPNMALPPCHTLFQFYVRGKKLSCQLYQRSVDAGLGLPFNIASYSLLTHMVAQQCGLQVGDFIHTSGDLHIYLNHLEGLKKQMCREPKTLPTLIIKTKPKNIFEYKYEDFEIRGYNPHPHIKLPVAV